MYLTKIYFPVMNLDNGDFTYDKEISTADLLRLQDEQFRRTNRSIEMYTQGYGKVAPSGGMFELQNKKATLDEVNSIPMECVVLGAKEGMEVTDNFFDDRIADGKMFIIRLNINPTVLDMDGESELRFWIDDSEKLLRDNALDNQTKIKHLPKRNIGIDTNGARHTLTGCKMIENKGNKKYPYYLAVIVEKIV